MGTWHLGNHEGALGQDTPAAGAFTVLKGSTNPAVDGDVGNRGYNDGRYALVSGAAAGKLHFDVEEGNVSAIKKGQACSQVASAGTAFEVVLCDCDDLTTSRMLGLASTDIVQNGTGIVVHKGILENVDTQATNLDVNPNAETWAAGDRLWVSNTAGGLTNVKPTSGKCIKAATTMKGSHATDTLLAFSHVNAVCSSAASGQDMTRRMGDSAGANKISYKDFANVEVVSMDSDGDIIAHGLDISTPLESVFWTSRHPFLDENSINENNAPSQVARGLFQGYSMPIWTTPANQYEQLLFRLRVPHRWDGSTNPWIVACVSISAAEDIGDKYKFQLEWQSEDYGNVIPATIQETLTCEITLTDGTAYYADIVSFELTATTLDPGQCLQMRLRRIAASSLEVSNEPLVWHWDTRWKMKQIGTVSIQGY